MSGIADAFRAGGVFMYPILAVSILSIAVFLERVMTLYFRAGVAKDALLKPIDKLIRAGQIDRAVKLASDSRTPLGRVIREGLLVFNEPNQVVRMKMDEAAVTEIPSLERRTGYLAMFSNVATLTGLLGTIVGLIHSFGAVANADAATKSSKLAEGISEAMNCTAFGLVVAIPALLFYALLTSRTHRVVDDIDEAAVHVYNVIVDVKEGVTRPADQAQV